MRLAGLLVFLVGAVSGVFGQTGMYGPVTAHLKAGDAAPDITFTRMLNAPGRLLGARRILQGR